MCISMILFNCCQYFCGLTSAPVYDFLFYSVTQGLIHLTALVVYSCQCLMTLISSHGMRKIHFWINSWVQDLTIPKNITYQVPQWEHLALATDEDYLSRNIKPHIGWSFIIDIYYFSLYIDKYFVITYAVIYWSKFWQLSNHGQEKTWFKSTEPWALREDFSRSEFCTSGQDVIPHHSVHSSFCYRQ